MRLHFSQRTKLLSTVAVSTLLALPAMAQEIDDTIDADSFEVETLVEDQSSGASLMLGRIVQGAGADKIAIDVPQAVSVVDQEDLDRAQAATVGDAIEDLPGVTVVGSESPWGESFNIRGIGAGAAADESKIIMQIDGVNKYYEQYRVGSLFTEPEFFKRIEVLRGPSSSTLYGAGAIGGVIAMETKDASDYLEPGETFGGSQRLQYSDNGDGVLSTTILAFAPDEQFESLLGFTYRDSGIKQAGGGQDITGTEGKILSGLAKATYSFGQDLEQEIEGSYFVTSSSVDDQVYNLVDATDTWGTVDRDFTDQTALLRYGFNPAGNDLLDLDVTLSYTDTTVEMSDAKGIFLPVSDYAYATTALKIENVSEWSTGQIDNYLTVGTSFASQDRSTGTTDGSGINYHPEGETFTSSLYAQNELVFDDRLTFITGLRGDWQDLTPSQSVTATSLDTKKSAYAANLALHYKITEAFSVFGSASYTERLPTLDEVYDTNGTSGGASDPALGTLNPESSKNFEIGASFSQNGVFTGYDQLAIKGVLFRNNMSDQIVRNNDGIMVGGTLPTYINLAKTYIEGFELEAAYSNERFYSSLAYTYLKGKNVGDPNATNPNLENQIPANQLSLAMGTFVPQWDMEFGWRGNYAEAATRYQSSSAVETPSYFVHDIYAVWRPDDGMFQNTQVRLGISNVADKEYRTHLMSTGTYRAGRTATLTLTQAF